MLERKYRVDFSLSFFLTPVNYFDSDPSMELLNAIVLDPVFPESGSSSKPSRSQPLAKRHANDARTSNGDLPAYDHDDNGVEQHFHCIPEPPAPFSYDAQVGLTEEFVVGKDEKEIESWARRVQGVMNPFALRFEV